VVIAAWRSMGTTSPSRRTVGRWRAWFAGLRETSWWTTQRGRLWPPIEPAEHLPAAIVDRLLPHHPRADALIAALRIVTSWATG
jgi:hypothetical protein